MEFGSKEYKKFLATMVLILTICFVVMGFAAKRHAEDYQGVTVRTGAVIDGEFVEDTSGEIGGNSEGYDYYNTLGTVSYILAVISGVACIRIFKKIKKES